MFKILILHKATLVKRLLSYSSVFLMRKLERYMRKIQLSLSAPPGNNQSKGTVVFSQDPKPSQQYHMEKRQSCGHSISARYPSVQESSCSAALICAGPQRINGII